MRASVFRVAPEHKLTSKRSPTWPCRALVGDIGQVVDIVSKHAKAPDFLKYGEDMATTKVNPALIIPHRDLWLQLRELHRRMTFSQKDMAEIFLQVADRNAASAVWTRRLTAEELPDYSDRMAKRLRIMTRHICQGLTKSTKWAVTMMSETEGDEAVASEAAVAAAPAKRPAKRPAAAPMGNEDQEYFYGFDHVAGKAFRQPATGGRRELTDLICKDDEADDAYPHALFSEDGPEIEIKNITVGELRERRRVVLQTRGSLWEGETPDGKRLRVARPSSQIPFELSRKIESNADWAQV